MLVTDEGIATLANELQLVKACCSILVTDEGMATLANELHPQKAPSSMLVTDEGMATLVNELHPWKAHRPILPTDVGMPTLVTLVLSTPNSAQESCPSPLYGCGCVMLVVPSGKSKCMLVPDNRCCLD